MYAIMEGVEDHDRTNGPIKAHLPCRSMAFAVGLVQSGVSLGTVADGTTATADALKRPCPRNRGMAQSGPSVCNAPQRTGRPDSPSCGLRVRRQVLMRTMTASSRELQTAATAASLADSARLATCGRTLSPPPAMTGSHGSHRPHAALPWEGRSAGRRSAWDDCGKARRPLADPGPSPGR